MAMSTSVHLSGHNCLSREPPAGETRVNSCVPLPWGFPGGSGGKEFACSVGDLGLIPGSGRSSGEGNGNPFQYSCLENSMDRGARRATVYGVPKSQTRRSN